MKIVKFFKNNTVLSNSWILLLGNGSVTLLNFVFVSVLSHNLPPGTYGNYREVFLYANLFVTFCVAGFAQTLYYFVNLNPNNKLAVIGYIRILLILIQLVVYSILLIIAFVNATYLPVNFNLDFLFFICYCFFTTLTLVDINLAIIYKKHKAIILCNVAILLVKLIVLLNLNYLSISNILVLSALIQFSLFIVNQFIIGEAYWGTIGLKKTVNFTLLKQILFYNIPLGISVLLGFLTSNTDRFILQLHNSNATNFAHLSNVAFEVPFIANIYTSFFTIALPVMIASYNNHDLNGFLKARFDYTKQVTLLVFPIVIGFMVWHNQFILFAFGQNYIPFAFLFAIYCLNSLIRVCSHIDIFLATNQTKYVGYIQFAEFVIRLCATYFLLMFFGFNGLIYAAVLTNFLYVFVVNYISARLLKTSLLKLFPYKFLFTQVLVVLATALLVKLFFETYFFNTHWLCSILFYGLIIFVWYIFSNKKLLKIKLLKTH